jgi:hypothetical protein
MLKDFLPKKVNLTKEQKKETKRQQVLAKEVIWPILVKNSKSVKDCQNSLKSLVVGLDAIFHQDVLKYSQGRSENPLHTLNLKRQMVDKGYDLEKELVEALKDESITTAKALIDGMDKELQRLLDKELMSRKLDELETEFL